ncbi:MAG TPA: protein kinase [Pyrinomonadaceae bacterium]|nr:protein kinase [Pyrinomonadaceae bacterium]
MKIERLDQIEEVFHAVLEVPVADREAVIAELCGSDAELRREVESLLAHEDTHDSLLDAPPDALAAEIFPQIEPNDLTGKTISHYKITKILGSGGMGEVYLAEDVKLRRKVALKILPLQFSADRERKSRFEKEAQAVSALNHPNIITIYEIEAAGSHSFMATEYIDGQTLRERTAEKAFSWQEAVRIAIQVASALESAHSVGIIHRDIKPANIMIRRDGIVKVLDFGLAKLTAPESGDFDTRDLTAPNRVMGTLNYMSPEQALGEMIDARTDIYSFGVVLFEMLTGRLPSSGDDRSTGSRPLTGADELNEAVPATLSQIVKHALKKDRNERYQTFADLRTDLKSLLRDSQTDGFDFDFTDETVLQTDPNKSIHATGSGSKSTQRAGRSAVWVIAPLLIAVLAVGVYWTYFYGRSGSAVGHFQSIKLDALTAHGSATSVAISPDGKYIAYAKNEDDGRHSLWLRQTASAGDTQIVPPGSAEYQFLKFSQDGNSLYSVASEGEDQPRSLYQMTTLGRNRRRIISGVDSQISFSPAGTELTFIRVADGISSILIADLQGGNERTVATRKYPEVYGDEISWSPDGRLIAVPTLTRGATYAGGMAVVDVATGVETRIPLKEEKLLRISQLAWTSDGKGIIYTPYAADMGQRYQIRYASYPSGEVQNITNDLSSYEDFSLTADSETMVAIQREYSMGIWLTAENDPKTATPITSKTAADDGERGISWTSDGKIVFVSSEGGAQNIWRMDADGSNPKPLTTDYSFGKILPTLSIGGDLITFLGRAVDPATKELVSGNTFSQMDSEGHNLRQVVDDPNCAFAPASANKEWVVYTSRADGIFRIWKAPLAGGAAVKLTDVDSTSPAISRDGTMIAYFLTEKGKPERVGIISIDGGTPIRTVELPTTASINAGIAWNRAGNGILFVNTLGTTSNIWVQPINGSKPTPLTAFKEFQIAAFALNSQGSRLAIARGSRNRDVVLIKNIRK